MLAVISLILVSSSSLAAGSANGNQEDLRATLIALVSASEPDTDHHAVEARVDGVIARLDGDQKATIAAALGPLHALPAIATEMKTTSWPSGMVGGETDLEVFRADFLVLLGQLRELSTLLDDPSWGIRLAEIEHLIESLPSEQLPLLHERYVAAAPAWREMLLHPDGSVTVSAKAYFDWCDKGCSGECDLADIGCWICKLEEALCDVGAFVSVIGNFVTDFFHDVEQVFLDIGNLPEQIRSFLVGLVSDLGDRLLGLVDNLLATIPSSPEEVFEILGIDPSSVGWVAGVLAMPNIDLPCPAIGTEIPGIGIMGSIQAEYTCKRGIDWAAAMIYDVVPDDIYNIPIKAFATVVYCPINYFCLCVEAQSNISFFGDQAAHRELVRAKLDAVLSTRSSQVSVDVLSSSLADLDGDVAVVGAKADTLEVKLDSLQVSQDQNSDSLALFNELLVRLNIEEHMLDHPDDVILLFQQPQVFGGYLEDVRDIVTETIAMNKAARQRTFRAQAELNAGNRLYAAGDWSGAFRQYRRAYEEAVKR